MKEKIKVPWSRVVVVKAVQSDESQVYFEGSYSDRICRWTGYIVWDKGKHQGQLLSAGTE